MGLAIQFLTYNVFQKGGQRESAVFWPCLYWMFVTIGNLRSSWWAGNLLSVQWEFLGWALSANKPSSCLILHEFNAENS